MVEKKSEHDLSDDLNKIFKNFMKLKESYVKEQSLRQNLEGTIKDLKEENQVVHEAEKAERNKLIVTRQLITQQQDNFSNLLFVKSENLKLSSQIEELEESLQDTKKRMADERLKWETDQEKIKANHSLEMKKMELNNEKRVWDLQREAEITATQYKMQIAALTKSLEQKENELTVIVFKYEEKLQELKEKENSLEADILKIQERASRDILLHKKKAMELEQEYTNLLRQKQEAALLPQVPVRKTFEFANASPPQFRTPRTLPERPSLQSILKKSSSYGSVMRKSLVSSPDDFSASAKNTSEKAKETSEEIHSTTTSTTAEMNNNDVDDAVLENPPEVGPETPREVVQPQGKKSKFTPARKRKLFRSYDLEVD